MIGNFKMGIREWVQIDSKENYAKQCRDLSFAYNRAICAKNVVWTRVHSFIHAKNVVRKPEGNKETVKCNYATSQAQVEIFL